MITLVSFRCYKNPLCLSLKEEENEQRKIGRSEEKKEEKNFKREGCITSVLLYVDS